MAEAEKLISRILEDARLQAEANIIRAKSEAAGIIEAAEKSAEQRRTEIIEKAGKEAEEVKKRLVAVAELEARKLKLQVKQDIIEEAFTKALSTLNTMPDQDYQNILTEMIISSIETGNEEVVLSERDKSRIGPGFINDLNDRARAKGLNGGISLSNRTAVIKGGFILRSGDIEVNNSFETIIKMKRNEIEPEMVALLF